MLRTLVILSAIICVGAAGCAADRERQSETVTALAAASLNDVLNDLAKAFEARDEASISISSGASGALCTQIELGVRCDVFLSADPALVDRLDAVGMIVTESRRVVAHNRLTIAVTDPALAANGWPDALASDALDRIAVADPDTAPAGRYAKQALMRMGLWDRLQPKLVHAGDARSAVNLLAERTVDAAIVYETDATGTDGVTIVYRFDAKTHAPIEYVGAIVTSPRVQTEPGDAAARFLSFLGTDAAGPIWKKHGFTHTATETVPKGVIDTTSHLGFSGDDARAIGLSLRVSLGATVVCIVIGVPVAVWLGSGRSRWRFVVDLMLMAPLVVPPVVTGFGLLLVLRAVSAGLLFSLWAATAAAAVVALPLLVRTVRVAVEQTDPGLAKVAATLGASRWRIFWTVTIPMSWRGVVGGAALAWARAFGEFGATIVVAGNMPGRTRTLPLAIWTSLQSKPLSSVVGLVVAALLLSVAAVALSEWIVQRANRESHVRSTRR